jgi:hypothetical protein
MNVSYQNILKNLFFLFLLFVNISVFAQLNPVSGMSNKTSAAGKEHKKHKDTVADAKKGKFIPVPFFVTDVNLGYGLILALSYLHPNKKKTRKDTPPSITAVFGGATSTKTWMVGGLHTHSFNDDKIRYAGALMYANMNIDFYNLGSIDLSDRPIEINMNGWGIINRVLFRMGKSDIFIGPQYGYASIADKVNLNSLDNPVIPELPDKITRDYTTIFSAIGLLVNYDSRDNTISPSKGFYGGFKLNYNATWLGATDHFANLDAFFYAYIPINKWLSSIYHFEYDAVGDDAPFYVKPYLDLRGAPVMYYQGNMTALVETQWRALIYKNVGVIGFVGTGKAFDSFSEFADDQWVVNYGTGLRYVLQKAFNTRVGVDFAWANPNSQFGWYIVVGTSF